MGKKKSNRDYSEGSENDDLEYEYMYGDYESVSAILERDNIKPNVKYIELAIANKNYLLISQLITKGLLFIKSDKKFIDSHFIKFLIKNNHAICVEKILSWGINRNNFIEKKIIESIFKYGNDVLIASLNAGIISKKNIKKYVKMFGKKDLIEIIISSTTNYFKRILKKAIKKDNPKYLKYLNFPKHIEIDELIDYFMNYDSGKIFDFFCENVIPMFDAKEICAELNEDSYEVILPLLFDDIEGYYIALDYCEDEQPVIDYIAENYHEDTIIEFIEDTCYSRKDFGINYSCEEYEICNTCSSCEDCGRNHMKSYR
jgi:hypothetical protein